MSPTLLDTLIQWSDVQSLATRTPEVEVTFKTLLARKMFSVVLSLFKWQRHLNSSMKTLGLNSCTNHLSGTEKRTQTDLTELDGLEASVVLGDGDDNSDTDHVMDQDQDTETEMPAEGDIDHGDQDDSDIDDEDEVQQIGHGHQHGGSHHINIDLTISDMI